ncbi:MAG TPA: hypothetical protein VKU86_09340 [Acidimicrobiales bacterium]|nr:hypothetical protein [Acidimicrobiales bacterium]
MSFLEIVSGAAEGGDVNALRSMLGPAISAGIREGLSGASMLRTFRAAGGAIRTYDFQRLVGEVRASEAAAGTWVAQPLDAIPGADAFVTHTGSAFSGYEYRVPIFYREREGEELTINHSVFTVRVREPITPAEAQAQAMGIFTEGQQTGTGATQQLLGFGTPGLHVFGP